MTLKTLLQTAHAAGTTSTANTTQYWLPGATLIAPVTVEASRQVVIRSPGTFSNLTIYLGANSIGGSGCEFRIRVNGANGNSLITVGASQTGEFTDSTNSDSVSAGDKITYSSTPLSATGVFIGTIIQSSFQANTNTVTKCASLTGRAAVGTGTLFYPIGNQGSTAQHSTETWSLTRIRKAGTLKFLAVQVSANTRSSTTTIRTRKNSVNGNGVLSISAGATGTFEDTSNTDSVASGDDINYSIVTAAGTGTITVESMQCEYETTDNSGFIYCMDTGGNSVAAGITTRFTLSGGTGFNASEFVTHVQPKTAYRFSNLVFRSAINSVSGTSTLRLRKNETDTSLEVIIPASTTGLFEDNSNTEDFTATDEPNFNIAVGAGTGSNLFTGMGVHYASVSTLFERVVDESLTVTSASLIQVGRPVSESLTVDDAVAMLVNRFLIESPTITDAVTLQIGRFVTASLTVTDAVARFFRANRSVSESLTVDDVVARMVALFRNLSESLTVTDAVTGILHFLGSVSESFTINDAVARFYRAVKTVAESLTINDTVTILVRRFVSESLTVIDVVARVRRVPKAISESLTVNDAVARFYRATRSVSESLEITDVIAVLRRVPRSILESLSVNDAVERTVSFYRNLAESLTINDVVERMLQAFRSLTETVELTANGIGTRTVLRSLDESLSITDNVARLRRVPRQVSESLEVTADVIADFVGLFRRNVSESFVVVANVVRKVCRILPFLNS